MSQDRVFIKCLANIDLTYFILLSVFRKYDTFDLFFHATQIMHLFLSDV